MMVIALLLLFATHSYSLSLKVLIKAAESVKLEQVAYMKQGGEKKKVGGSFRFSAKDAKKVLLLPKKGSFIKVDGRPYRGYMLLNVMEGKVFVINVLDLEDYLLGVIKGEISPEWRKEAVKAQCIVARTFAVANLGKHKEWDVCSSSTCCQVYGGVWLEDRRVEEAVKDTKGMILFWKGSAANLVYHACCGGQTFSPKQIWGWAAPYLVERRCSFCRRSPHFQWKNTLSLKKIEERLKQEGILKSEILHISEKGDKLKICTKKGCILLSKHRFRMLMGPNIIKSAQFTIRNEGKNIKFSGKGWGHGVGMCQWGTKRMAEIGFSASQILQWYFPGTKCGKLRR